MGGTGSQGRSFCPGIVSAVVVISTKASLLIRSVISNETVQRRAEQVTSPFIDKVGVNNDAKHPHGYH